MKGEMLMTDDFTGKRIGFAMTGSFCSFERCFAQAERLASMGAELIPIMSENAAAISSRFGKNEDNVKCDLQNPRFACVYASYPTRTPPFSA